MSRIRTIKPELPQSETIGRLSRDGRLLFVQLFTIADDAGRFRAASRMLASLLYPYDDDAPGMIVAWLDELERNGIIRRWVVDGATYGEIINWLKHQKIDRPSPSRLPAYSSEFAKPREESRTLDADLVPSTLDLVPVPSTNYCSTSLSDWPSDFREKFWKNYPRRVGKQAAIRSLEKIKKRGVSFSALMAGVSRIPSTELQFVPHPTTWLNRGGWEDEVGGFSPVDGPPDGLTGEQRAKWIREKMEQERAEKPGGNNGIGSVLERGKGFREQERVGPKLVCDNTRDD